MNIIRKITSRFSRRSLTEAEYIRRVFGIPIEGSGIYINAARARQISTVWNAINIIAGSIAMLPLNLMQRTNGRTQIAAGHPYHDLFHNTFNPEINNSFLARETLQEHLLLRGNCYAEIRRGYGNNKNAPDIVALYPLNPDNVLLRRNKDTKDLEYLVTTPDGKATIIQRVNMLHIPGLGSNGLTGYSVVSLARESLGLAAVAEKFGSSFFAKGTHPGIIVKHPGKLSEPAHNSLRNDLTEKYSGLGQAHRLMLLEEGMDVAKLGFSPEDSQFLETREFQVEEIARWFNLPPHKLKKMDRATFSNIEHQNIEFLTESLMSWLIRWETCLNTQLLTPVQRKQGLYFKFNAGAMLRGDTKSRYEAHAIGRQGGWLSVNEIRAMEDMNPIENGDVYLEPLNMAPAGTQATEADPQQVPADDPTGTEKEKKALLPPAEIRDWDPIARNTVAADYAKAISEKLSAIIKTETESIRLAVGRIGDDDFINKFIGFINSFYDEENGSFPASFRESMGPILENYLLDVIPLAAAEAELETELTDELTDFVDGYIDRFVGRYMDTSSRQLSTLVLSDPEPAEAVLERMDKWEEDRPEDTAKYEKVRASNAMALAVWWSAGIGGVWETVGKSCPWCKALHGKKIMPGENFVGPGMFEPSGATGSMKIRGIVRHAPLHKGCDCRIRPGR